MWPSEAYFGYYVHLLCVLGANPLPEAVIAPHVVWIT